MKGQRAYAAIGPDGWIDVTSIRSQAGEARRAAGHGWASKTETHQLGWERAKRDGWRVRPIFLVEQPMFLAMERGAIARRQEARS